MARDPKSDDRPQSQPTGVVGQDKKPPEPVYKIAFEWRMLKKIEQDKYREAITEAGLSDGQRMTEEEFDKAMAAGSHPKDETKSSNPKDQKDNPSGTPPNPSSPSSPSSPTQSQSPSEGEGGLDETREHGRDREHEREGRDKNKPPRRW